MAARFLQMTNHHSVQQLFHQIPPNILTKFKLVRKQRTDFRQNLVLDHMIPRKLQNTFFQQKLQNSFIFLLHDFQIQTKHLGRIAFSHILNRVLPVRKNDRLQTFFHLAVVTPKFCFFSAHKPLEKNFFSKVRVICVRNTVRFYDIEYQIKNFVFIFNWFFCFGLQESKGDSEFTIFVCFWRR